MKELVSRNLSRLQVEGFLEVEGRKIIVKDIAGLKREQTSSEKEEQILFPYINALERSANGNESLEPPFFQTVQNPIHSMMKDHDAAGDLVKQIRKASADYTPPADACTSYKALYRELHDFEADLHQHVHLENNILFPRAVDMETALVERG